MDKERVVEVIDSALLALAGENEIDDLIFRLRERARIRRSIPHRKSVQNGEPDRIADLLDEAADVLTKLRGWDRSAEKVEL